MCTSTLSKKGPSERRLSESETLGKEKGTWVSQRRSAQGVPGSESTAYKLLRALGQTRDKELP